MIRDARIWLGLNRHWFVIGLVVAVALAALLTPGERGIGWWIAIILEGLTVFLLAVYGLTRFVMWASWQR
jgi:hypothetical protein